MRNRVIVLVLALLMASLIFNSTANAQVTVVRGGSENPVLTIGKSTFYGTLTGTLLGLALNLVVDESFGDVMKWSIVGGTFGGFFIGIYHVATRPQPGSASLLQFDSNGLVRIAVPEPELRFSRMSYFTNRSLDVKLNLVSMSL